MKMRIGCTSRQNRPRRELPPVEEHICDAVSDLAVHAAWCILERNSDAVILEVRRRAARPCLEGSKSRNRPSERCAWPVVFLVGRSHRLDRKKPPPEPHPRPTL